MIANHSSRPLWSALALSGALLVGAGTTVVGADAEGEPADSPAAAEASPMAAEASPAASPVATFDPAAVDLRLDLFVDGLQAPVAIASDRTGSSCLYVVERGGTVRIVDATSGEVGPKPFLDISRLISVGPEQGLHSIAFHPDFKKNRRFFAHYNARDDSTVVAEFKARRPCKPARSKPVKPLKLTVVQPFPNNNGGWMDFGPDGYLYLGLGDGGGVSPGDPDGIGQSKSARLAKILRLDVDRGRAAVPPKDNPYAKKRKGFDPLTWAWGLRDPRHASFDPETGDLWIADVGQDRFEEVDRIPAGSVQRGGPAPNFGWSHMEGDRCHNLPDCDTSAYLPPVYFYDKVPPYGGITGGYVYRGEAMPELQGVYLFSDRLSGHIWGLDANAVAAGEPVTAHQLFDAPQGIVAFGEADDGELYVIVADGSIFRVEPEEA